MTLQERILEALAERDLPPRALYDHFRGDMATAVDFAIRGLMRENHVSLTMGAYSLTDIARRACMGALARQRTGNAAVEITGQDERPITVAIVAPEPTAEAPKFDIERRRNPTFSAALIGRLIEQQRSLAMSVQVLDDRLSMKRQELADIEELVRMATEGGMR